MFVYSNQTCINTVVLKAMSKLLSYDVCTSLCQVKPVKQDSVPVSQSVPEASSPAKDSSIEDLKQEPDELLDNSDEELGILSNMIQTAQFHHPHPRSFQVRQELILITCLW